MTRIDKWLWAARFFKTRAQAKDAIDGGKVHLNGQRTKPSHDVKPGDVLKVRAGYDEKTVAVLALSEQRRGAPEAQLLYEETPESRATREAHALARKVAGAQVISQTRPNKKERRQIHKFRDENG